VKRPWLWLGLALLPLGAVFASLFVGRYPVGFRGVIGAIFGGEASTLRTLILQVRLPRAIAAALVGADLALAGALFQGLFRNPLVDSRILGVSSGAAFGAALALLLGVPWYAVDGVSLVGGIVAALLVVGLARRFGSSVLMLVISGILVGSLFSSLVGLVKYAADPLGTLPAITYWLLGSLSGADWAGVIKLFPVTLIGGVFLSLAGWRLDVLSLEEREAASLGMDVGRLRLALVMVGTLIVASAVSQAGVIGWIGLITPHAARALLGPGHSRVLPASAALGAFFLTVLDILARSLSRSEIPLGILTGIIGAPVFLLLFMRRLSRGGGWA
jgi:iron complex transport system permease protein